MNYFILVMSLLFLDFSLFGMNTEVNSDDQKVGMQSSVVHSTLYDLEIGVKKNNQEPELVTTLESSILKIDKDTRKKCFCYAGCASVFCIMPLMLGLFLPTKTLHVQNDTGITLRIGCVGAVNTVKSGYPTRLRCTQLKDVYADDVDNSIVSGSPTDNNLKKCRNFTVKEGLCNDDENCEYDQILGSSKKFDKKLVWDCIENSKNNETLYQSFELERKNRLRNNIKN